MRYAPIGYECPFCRLEKSLEFRAPDSPIVLMEPRVFACIPLHHYGGIRGNCILMPRDHYENVFDIPADLGADFFEATRKLSAAMQRAFACDGISTRQHNGPAGNQDVWHYHLHIFPRFEGDALWGGAKAEYDPAERLEVAARLRAALG